jgi:flagellar protein FlgJ
VNGQPGKQGETFRAYDSYADAFRDYANLLRGNARYPGVIAQGGDAAGFAQGLQQAGYATDPAYARKLTGAIRLVEKA